MLATCLKPSKSLSNLSSNLSLPSGSTSKSNLGASKSSSRVVIIDLSSDEDNLEEGDPMMMDDDVEDWAGGENIEEEDDEFNFLEKMESKAGDGEVASGRAVSGDDSDELAIGANEVLTKILRDHGSL